MFQEIQVQLSEILRGVVDGFIASIPQLLAGTVLIVLAFLLAKVVERVLRAIMVRLRFDALIRRSGVDNWLTRMGIRQSLDDVVPRVVYFILLFLFAREAADSLGLTAISEAIGSLINYLPSLISAFLIVLIGGAIAQVAGRAVTEAGRGMGLDFAPLLGRLLTGILLFVLIVMALGELEVQTILVRDLAVIVVAGGMLAFSLSFGLGSRDVTRNILAGFYVRRVFSVGDQVEVAGHKGTIIGITPTQTILQKGERTVVLSNGAFLDSAPSR